MQARIYETIKPTIQSGLVKRKWIIDFLHDKKSFDDVMGWSSSNDTMPQVNLEFDSLKKAKEFASSKGWTVDIIKKNDKPKRIKKSYSDNFTN